MNLRLIMLFLFLFAFPKLRAQYYDTGTDPAALKWLQIKTDHFRVIYPESFGKEGIRYAMSLDSSFARLSALYPMMKTNIPVIIHNHTTFSNGYVAWAPRRMEIYPTPEQNTIPLDPVDQLTLHELTHVMQMYSLKKGFSNILSFIFGEQYTGAISIFMPMWFMEGDAVLAESVLSGSGRGRSPSFQKQVRALAVEKGRMYSYDKMLHSSFKDYTPDHYRYGYQMMAWSYAKYNHQPWNNALAYTAKYPFTGNPVNFSLRKSGLTKAAVYRETYDTLKAIWEKDITSSQPVIYSALNRSKGREFINYHSPVVTGKDSIVAIKTSYYDPPSFVLIRSGSKTEKRLHIPGIMNQWFLSGAVNKLVWVEQHPDARWENRDYSVIKIHDMKNGTTWQLSFRSRYLAVSLSPDGRYIAASENRVDNSNSLVIIDASDGKVLNTVAAPDNVYLQRPQWSASGNEVTSITLDKRGEGIILYSVTEKKWKNLLRPGTEDLQSSFLRNDSLFYTASASGTENIYLRRPDGETERITDTGFGASDPVFYGNSVYFSEYTSSGENIAGFDITDIPAGNYKDVHNESFLINSFDTLKDNSINLPRSEYKPEPYRKWMHPFRFHSWMPFYADVEEVRSDPASIRPGITFMSQNNLSTLITTVGYEYSDNRHKLHSKITWKGWIPVVESRIDYDNNPETNSDGTVFTNSVSVPLTFSTGKFSQYIWTSVSASYYDRHLVVENEGIDDYGQLQLTERFYLSNYMISAIRDIYPTWAQVFDFYFTSYPADKDIYGSMRTLKTAFYFPGFLQNHSIKLRFEAEHQKPENYSLLMYNRASLPRGYSDIISLDYRFYSADYVMPLIYPDLNIPGVLFLKRIRGGLFYDYARGTDNIHFLAAGNEFRPYTETFRSFGAEMLADFYLLRIPFMISGGVQAAWKNFGEAPSLQLLLKIDVFGMKVGKNKL